jgi:CTP:molybdopterin cytidylyltransferase MocA
MGGCKQLLPLDGRPAVVRVVETLLAGGAEGIIVVVNPEGGEIEAAVARHPVTVTVNPLSDSDMAGSVRVGLSRVPTGASGVLVCLADTPLVTAATCRRLIDEHLRTPDAILIPTHRGRKGHPTLFPRHILEAIHTEPTLRDLIRANIHRVALLEVPDPWVTEDMDTPEDYRRLEGRLPPTRRGAF